MAILNFSVCGGTRHMGTFRRAIYGLISQDKFQLWHPNFQAYRSWLVYSRFAISVKWQQKYEKWHISLYSKKIYFPYIYWSKVFICYSRDSNETFCKENNSVAIILRSIDKITGLSRDPQLQVGGNYYLFDLRPSICKSKHSFVHNNIDF